MAWQYGVQLKNSSTVHEFSIRLNNIVRIITLQCVDTTWANSFVNSNFMKSDSNFHGLILKIPNVLKSWT